MPSLDALCAAKRRPELVVAQPDRPAGRGRKVARPPVVERATELGLELAQPASVRDEDFLALLRTIGPDWCVVVAFGQIFPRPLLELPQRGCVNVHASLLPAYRGAAPIQAALAAGEAVTGVSIMRMEEGLDTGPVVLQRELAIGPRETAPELSTRLAKLGGDSLVEALAALEEGLIEAWPQDVAAASYAPRLSREDGRIDWARSAREICDRLRAFTPWPGAFFERQGERVKVLAATVDRETETDGASPGTILGLDDSALLVAAGDASVVAIGTLQRPGRKASSGADFLHGARAAPGEPVSGPGGRDARGGRGARPASTGSRSSS